MKTSEVSELEGKITSVLEEYNIQEAAIFGSLSRGEADSESDIDILVVYPSGTNLFDTFNLQDKLEAVTGRKVDLVSKNHLPRRLEKRIKYDTKPLKLSV